MIFARFWPYFCYSMAERDDSKRQRNPLFDLGKTSHKPAIKRTPPARGFDRQGFYARRAAKAASAIAGFALRGSYEAVLAARRFVLSLYGQLFFLSLVFVVIVEAVLLVSSLAQDQERWLVDRVHQAELASQAIDTAHEGSVSPRVASQLLKSANVEFLAIWNNGVRTSRLWDGTVVVPDRVIDLDVMHKNILHDIAYLWSPWKTMTAPSGRLLHIQATPKVRSGQLIEIVVRAQPLREFLKSSVISSLRVSLSISLAAGLLVFASLSAFIVHPIRQLTRSIVRFKANPEQVAATPELAGRHDEIAQIARELESMQEEVRDALRSRARLAALGQAVSKINHDLRNMLTSAQMASDRLSAVASSDPSAAKALPRLERALDRALSLASNVLTYGKSDEHAPNIQIVRLKDLAEAAAEDAGLGLTARSPENVRFVLRAPKGFYFEADPEQMHRLLVNLMRNARQAIELQLNRRERGRVTLTAVKTTENVILILNDNGPGIPEKIREKLFQPFTSSATPGGSGLGLAIARELGEIHGGDVRLMSTGPNGTAFEVRLPLKG